MRVLLTPIAEADLVSIFDWLAHRDIDFAAWYVSKLYEAELKFGDFPRLGALRPEWGNGVRARFVDRYCFAYRIGGDQVEILRIVHTSRDLDRLLTNNTI